MKRFFTDANGDGLGPMIGMLLVGAVLGAGLATLGLVTFDAFGVRMPQAECPQAEYAEAECVNVMPAAEVKRDGPPTSREECNRTCNALEMRGQWWDSMDRCECEKGPPPCSEGRDPTGDCTP